MSDETGSEWKMPEPVFRSSEGRKPGETVVSQSELPTDQPGFIDDKDKAESASSKQSVRAKTGDRKERYTKKKRGCAKTFGMIVGAIALLILAGAAALVYLLFYYRPVDTTTF
jgi:hypothetical protein